MSNVYTLSGDYLDLLAPEGHPFRIEDIATALSRINRFAGHTDGPYSVASHSILVSHIVPPGLALQGLMHDAAEAYMGDVMTPLKALLPRYQAIEDRLLGCILRHFDIEDRGRDAVKRADRAALLAEKWQILHCYDPWDSIPEDTQVVDYDIRPRHAGDARLAARDFLDRYEELTQ